MEKPKPSAQIQINAYLTKLAPDLQETIAKIRDLMLGLSPNIAEQIKWNSPSFYYTGQMQPFDPKTYKSDIMVCNVHRGKLLLVFPTGAKVKDNMQGKDYPDGRKIITITDLADLKTKEASLIQLIKNWLQLINE